MLCVQVPRRFLCVAAFTAFRSMIPYQTMKWVLSGLGAFCLVVVAVLLVLTKQGVMIRPQPLIKPTLLQADFVPAGEHVFLRLFPDLRDVRIILLRWAPDTADQQFFLADFKKNFEFQLKRELRIQFKAPNPQDLRSCESACLFVLPEINVESELQKSLNESQAKWISIRMFEFDEIPESPDHCLKERKLTEDCLFYVVLNLVRKKVAAMEGKLFFLYKYLDQDFYLFVRGQSSRAIESDRR